MKMVNVESLFRRIALTRIAHRQVEARRVSEDGTGFFLANASGFQSNSLSRWTEAHCAPRANREVVDGLPSPSPKTRTVWEVAIAQGDLARRQQQAEHVSHLETDHADER